ncbi:MAG: zinc ribbon domain-containing protein [Methanomassiliicoccaceae archaeon]|nr:zinc ribbon domain-containing protein [Methanomassiliicoccaceae archaeon]
MIEHVSKGMRALFVSLVAAIFICSAAFGYVFVVDGSVSDDESKAFTFAAVFAAVFIALNVTLLIVGYMIYRKAKQQRTMIRCPSCGTFTDPAATACPKCHTVRPDESTYLEPKENDDIVVKK